MIQQHQPKIFAGHKVTVRVSSNTDGQMSIDAASDEDARTNIATFINRKNYTLIHCTYDKTSFATIRTVENPNQIKDVSPDNRLVCDALTTNKPNITLAVPVADCIATVLYDPMQHVAAIAHLGRHATADKLAQKLVQFMQETYNSQPKDLLAYLSPSIKKTHYAMQYWKHTNTPEWTDFVEHKNDLYYLDLPGFNTQQLIQAGLIRQHIEVSPINTATSRDYGSHYEWSKDQSRSNKRFLVSVELAM